MNPQELKALIQQQDDLPREPFPTPEWPELDGQLFVRGMTADEGDEHEIFMANHSDLDGKIQPGTPYLSARIGVKGLVDVDGDRLFTDSPEDIAILSGKANILLNRLYFKVRKLSGIGKAAAEALEKNSERTPGDSSPST